MSLSHTMPTDPHVVPRILTRGIDVLRRALTGPRADATARPPTAAGERVLISAVDREGRPVVATSHGLYHRDGPAAAHGWTRWGWELVHRADWNADRRALTLSSLGGRTPTRAVLRLPAGDRVAELVGEQIAAHAVVDTVVRLGDGGSTRVSGRRRPGSGELMWVVTHPERAPGVPADVRTDDLIEATITRLSRELGR